MFRQFEEKNKKENKQKVRLQARQRGCNVVKATRGAENVNYGSPHVMSEYLMDFYYLLKIFGIAAPL